MKRLLPYFLIPCLFAGCATNVSKEDLSLQDTIIKARTLALANKHQIAASLYLEVANGTASPKKDRLLLRVLDLALKAGNYRQAEQISKQINSTSLSSRERVLFQLLSAKSALNLGHQKDSLKYLDQISPSLLAEQEQKLYHILRIKTLLGLGKEYESVEERIKLSRFLDDGESFSHNNQSIKKTLRHISPEWLNSKRTTATQTLRGWIDYTLIHQLTNSESTERKHQLQRWHDQYPGHSASYRDISVTGSDDEQAPALEFEIPDNVAVILPHSGIYMNASQAIKQGMLAARTENQDLEQPRIQFYDSASGDIEALYQQIIRDNADLIIGPLQKGVINQLVNNATITPPMIALNQLDTISQPNVFQTGLNPRDDIEQSAAMAWQAGHKRALVFIPDTKAGQRSGQLFNHYWTGMGGITLEIATYPEPTKELTKAVSLLLNQDESLARRSRLQKLVGTVDFEPRPRHDADMVFIVAKPTQARIIRPLLQFFRLSDLPIYATSKVYSGTTNPSLDRDLNDIIFCASPHSLSNIAHTEDQDSPEVAQKTAVKPANLPLYHLGYDTYNLMFALSGMLNDPSARFPGKTGTLWLDENNHIRRQLMCGQFSNGNVKPLGPGPILQPTNQAAENQTDTSDISQEQHLQTNDGYLRPIPQPYQQPATEHPHRH